jgi:hypothetical protein
MDARLTNLSVKIIVAKSKEDETGWSKLLRKAIAQKRGFPHYYDDGDDDDDDDDDDYIHSILHYIKSSNLFNLHVHFTVQYIIKYTK